MLTVKEEVAKNLQYYRKKNNLTQKELAEKIGVKHNSISSWESATNSIDVEILFKICNVLKLSINDLYGVFSNDVSLTQLEYSILSNYRSLNNDGQDKARDYIDDLSSNPKYLKASINPAYTEKEKSSDVKTPSRPLIAARSGGVKPATDQQMKDLELFAINYEKEKKI